MKTIKHICIVMLLLISITGCKEKVDVYSYVVTPEFSKQIDKPEVHFKILYPKTLEFTKPKVGKKNSSYGMLMEKNDAGLVTEMCSFGYISLDGMAFESSGKSFLIQIKDMLKGAGYKIEEDKIGMVKFDGEKYLSLNLIGVIPKGISDIFEGRYYFNAIVRPNPNGNTHIIMLMAARDDQLDAYKDFEDKLSISTVWQSFKYL